MRSKLNTKSTLIAGLCSILFCSTLNAQSQNVREVGEPEAATGYIEKKAVHAKEYMVASANPHASMAGKSIIEQGGSAIDAAIAVQAMLTLVEPQSSGIGGGAFILYWDNERKVLETYDGREMAPANVDSNWFMQDGKPMKWFDAVVGGKSVGVPGVLRALEMAHKDHGELAWQALFTDTIKVAEEGFEVSPRMAKLVAAADRFHKGLKQFKYSSSYYFPEGNKLEEGDIRKNPAYANVLKNIAKEGADYFYKGELAKKIADTVQNAPINAGLMTAEDLANYKAIKRQPVCGTYHDKSICGMAPPSSGGVNVFQLLKMLEAQPLADMDPSSVDFVNLYSQASALTFADREKYIADTDYTGLPFEALINDAYLALRAKGLDSKQAWSKAKAGNPFDGADISIGKSLEVPNTSHLSIIDKKGNALSMTTSIESMFGSGLMVEGFLLNNQLTDFSFNPVKDGEKVANRVEPGKRPRSAMSPTMVFNEKGSLELVVGSPGGSRIISYVAQTLIGVLDMGLNIQEAINLPKITNRNDYTALEKGTPLAKLKEPLEKLGHNVKVIDLNSGLHGIQITENGYLGGADPRREGVALGE